MPFCHQSQSLSRLLLHLASLYGISKCSPLLPFIPDSESFFLASICYLTRSRYIGRPPKISGALPSLGRELFSAPMPKRPYPDGDRFIVLRYAAILANFPALFFTSIQNNHCQLAVALSQVGAVLVVAASGLIFVYRVIAIWNGLRIISIVVGVMYVIMLSCWVRRFFDPVRVSLTVPSRSPSLRDSPRRMGHPPHSGRIAGYTTSFHGLPSASRHRSHLMPSSLSPLC